MVNKTKLRILSKVGILLVFIGFFLPISCNQNGFQIAKTLETLVHAMVSEVAQWCQSPK